MNNIQVTRTYLQMTDRSELFVAKLADERVRVERVLQCPPSFFRYLYQEVGRQYHWVDRLEWTDEQICQYLSQPSISLGLLSYTGAPAGYFELRQHEDGSVEIAYFGLLQEFQGRGLGKLCSPLQLSKAGNLALIVSGYILAP